MNRYFGVSSLREFFNRSLCGRDQGDMAKDWFREITLDWICGRYVNEVFYSLYAQQTPAEKLLNGRFLDQIEKPIRETGIDINAYRRSFWRTVDAYKRSGIAYRWNSEPGAEEMFLRYYAHYVKSPTGALQERMREMQDLIEYMNEWIRNAAYFIWVEEGKPEGRDAEHWEKALQKFIEAHS